MCLWPAPKLLCQRGCAATKPRGERQVWPAGLAVAVQEKTEDSVKRFRARVGSHGDSSFSAFASFPWFRREVRVGIGRA